MRVPCKFGQIDFQHLYMVVTCSLIWDSASCEAGDNSTPSKKPDVYLRTAYLAESVGSARQIAIAGQLGVTLDGNTCTTNLFGDPQFFTKVLFHAIDVTIDQIRLADSGSQVRRIFRLAGELEPEGAILVDRTSTAQRITSLGS